MKLASNPNLFLSVNVIDAMDRDSHLLTLRPTVVTEETTGVEHIQNTILRPILKFQHALLLQILHASPLAVKQLSKIDNEQDYHLTVKKLLTNDSNLRGTLVGAIIGLMTVEEYIAYAKNQREMNKRIITMLAKRYTDTWVQGWSEPL